MGHPQRPRVRRLLDIHCHARAVLLQHLAVGVPPAAEQLHL